MAIATGRSQHRHALDDFARARVAEIRGWSEAARATAVTRLASRRDRLTTKAVIQRRPATSAEMRTKAAEIDAFIAQIEAEEPVR